MMMRNVVLRCSVLLAALSIDLGSCNLTAGIDTLLSAPRLTVEQEQIYQALLAATNSGIKLKYPKSGEYLSAFTVYDFDDDGADEAIVFYEISNATAEENPLRICLLDQKDGEWRAVNDHTTAGAEVEWVMISKLGENERTNLIVGYSMVDGAEHTAEVMHYEDGTLVASLTSEYSFVDIRDLDCSGTNELVVIKSTTLTTVASARVYELDATGTYVSSPPITLPETFVELNRPVYGTIPTEDQRIAGTGLAMYLDGMTGATTMQTEILKFSDGQLRLQYSDSLVKMQYQDGSFTSTVRPVGYKCMDIDNDGEIEIPIQSVFYGYGSAEKTEQLFMTCWYVYRGGLLVRESASYYSLSNGYIFLLPEKWEKKVTAAVEQGETVFYEWDSTTVSADGKPVLKKPLLHLAVAENAEQSALLQADDYCLLRQNGDKFYLAKTEHPESNLAITESDLVFAMRYVS